jgi:hypothetical protein
VSAMAVGGPTFVRAIRIVQKAIDNQKGVAWPALLLPKFGRVECGPLPALRSMIQRL